MTSTPTVSIPLGAKPNIGCAWRCVHGSKSYESFVVPNLWAVHLYRYNAKFVIDGHVTHIRPGYAGFTPPGSRTEYYFEGRSVHVSSLFELEPSPLPHRQVPVLFPLGNSFELLWDRMEQVSALSQTDRLHSEIRLWDVLISIIGVSENPLSSSNNPKLVEQALAAIDHQLSESLTVEGLATQLSVSSRHLTRLFQASIGDTVIGTIQKKRMQRAEYLLQNTTISIKEIASLVGFTDLHHFNKSAKKHFGVAAGAIRDRGPAKVAITEFQY